MNLKYFSITPAKRVYFSTLLLNNPYIRITDEQLSSWEYPFPSKPKEGVYIHPRLGMLVNSAFNAVTRSSDWALVVYCHGKKPFYALMPIEFVTRAVNIYIPRPRKSYPGYKEFSLLKKNKAMLTPDARELLDYWELNELILPKARLRFTKLLKGSVEIVDKTLA